MRTQTTEARNFIENTLLVNWANAAVNGGGATELDCLRIMSQAMLRVAGDALYADEVALIDRLSDAARRTLASAHRDYAAAAALFSNDRANAALPAFKSARKQFGNSPFLALATFNEGAIAYASVRNDEAKTHLERSRNSPRKKLSLRGRTFELVPWTDCDRSREIRRRSIALRSHARCVYAYG